MSQLNWREYPANIPGPERHGSPLYLVRIEYDGTEAIVYDWFIRRPSDEELEARNLDIDYPDDYVGEWSENENVTHWIPASELLATVTPPIKQPSSNAPDPLWWFSWYTSPGADGVPVGATLGRELSDKVFGYWCSGSDMADRLTMVAMVSAVDEAAATALIVNEFGAFDELRFCEPKNLQRDDDGNLCRDQHGSGRFPLDDRGLALLNSWVAATLGAE